MQWRVDCGNIGGENVEQLMLNERVREREMRINLKHNHHHQTKKSRMKTRPKFFYILFTDWIASIQEKWENT